MLSEDFKLEHESGKPGQYVILLVDSEGPLERDDIPSWDHLRACVKSEPYPLFWA